MKVYIKKFEHKGQMINYYNKMKVNPNISCFAGWWCDISGYAIKYFYKNA